MPATPKVHITRRDEFSSIWLKYVTGVDLSVHCIQSLIGPRQDGISLRADTQTLELTQHPNPLAFYLCGVSTPYDWQRNAHLAFVAAEGETWEGDAGVRGLGIQLQDAAPIFGWGPDSVDTDDPNARIRLYRTCRNWQFAHEAKTRLGLTSRDNPEKSRYDARAAKQRRRGEYGHPTLGI